MGPSAATIDVALPNDPAPAWLPPYSLGIHPPDALVMSVLIVATVLAGLAVATGLWAVTAGWRPDLVRTRRLGSGLALSFCLVAPIGSADVLVYAAYGRMSVLGLDPYTTTPLDLAEANDPFGIAAERPWLRAASVYGPVATWAQHGAALVGGESVKVTVLVLALMTAVAFVVAGRLLGDLAAAMTGAKGEARVMVAWTLNPLLLFAVVAGVHVDALAVMFGVAALSALYRSAFAAGALVGIAGGVKLSIGLWGLGLLWAARRSLSGVVALCGGAALTVVPLYLVFAPGALEPIRAASRYASPASFWRVQRDRLEADGMAPADASDVVTWLSWVLVIVLVLALSRLAPAPTASQREGDPVPRAAVAITVVSLAWVLGSTYTLPWYDAMVWAPLALLAASALDWVLLVRTTTALLALLPGRAFPIDEPWQRWREWGRTQLAPVLAAGLVAWAICVGLFAELMARTQRSS